jgi:hypothetical protein
MAADAAPWNKTAASCWSTSTTEDPEASVLGVEKYPEKIQTWQGVREALGGNLEDTENFFMELQSNGFVLCVQRLALGKEYFDGVECEAAKDDELVICGNNMMVIPAYGYLSQLLVAAQQCHVAWGRREYIQDIEENTSQSYMEDEKGFHLVVRFLFNGKRAYVSVHDRHGTRYVSIGARAD